jgi:hypothetical protein
MHEVTGGATLRNQVRDGLFIAEERAGERATWMRARAPSDLGERRLACLLLMRAMWGNNGADPAKNGEKTKSS